MEYKDFYIDDTFIEGLYTVVYCGDEVVFDTLEEAKQFIDEIAE